MTNELARTGNMGLAVFEPQNFGELERLAVVVAKSQLFNVKTMESAISVMLTGASLGLPPVAALRGIHVMQGKAVLSSDLLVAVVLRSGQCARWTPVTVSAEVCTLETLRRGAEAPVRYTWTAEMAKKAGLWNQGTWAKYPSAMLRARCSAELARMVYPDVLFGVYVEGELGDDDAPAPQSTMATVVQMQAMAHVDDDVAASVARAVDGHPAEDTSDDEGPSSRAWGRFADTINGLPSLVAVHNAYNDLVTGLHEEGADTEHFLGGPDGAHELARQRMKTLRHHPAAAEALQILKVRALAEVIDMQTGINPAEDALQRAARWWLDHKAAVATLDEALRRAPWYMLVRRYSGATQAADVKAAGKLLEDAVKSLSKPPPTGSDAPHASGAANGNGAGAEASTMGPATRAQVEQWAADLRGCRSEAHVAGHHWKHAAVYRATGLYARILAVTIDELTHRGVQGAGAWLDAIGEKNGYVVKRTARAA